MREQKKGGGGVKKSKGWEERGTTTLSQIVAEKSPPGTPFTTGGGWVELTKGGAFLLVGEKGFPPGSLRRLGRCNGVLPGGNVLTERLLLRETKKGENGCRDRK